MLPRARRVRQSTPSVRRVRDGGWGFDKSTSLSPQSLISHIFIHSCARKMHAPLTESSTVASASWAAASTPPLCEPHGCCDLVLPRCCGVRSFVQPTFSTHASTGPIRTGQGTPQGRERGSHSQTADSRQALTSVRGAADPLPRVNGIPPHAPARARGGARPRRHGARAGGRPAGCRGDDILARMLCRTGRTAVAGRPRAGPAWGETAA